MAALNEGLDADFAALEALVVDNPDLAELEQSLAGVNLFEALGNVRREERHSDFLSFLLNPRQGHGLGDAVLRAFVQHALASVGDQPSPVRPVEVALYDLAEARVEREWNDVDILVSSEQDRFVLLIENKVDTDEHSGQLGRYLDIVRSRFPGWSVLPVFLTRDGHVASHPEYHPVSYSGVHGLLSAVLERQRASLPPDIEVAVRHYVQMLERHFMEDTRIAELARRIYARHVRALDLVLEHRPDEQEWMRQEIVRAIAGRKELRLVYSSKAYIQFVPVAWDALPGLPDGSDGSWVKQRELLRFEFKQQGGLTLRLTIGPGQEALRRRLYEVAGSPENKAVFRNRNSALYGKWTQVWRQSFIARNDEVDSSFEEKQKRFAEAWTQFVANSLPKLTDVFVAAWQGPASG